MKIRDETLAYFYTGADNKVSCMYNDLMERVDASGNIVKISGRYDKTSAKVEAARGELLAAMNDGSVQMRRIYLANKALGEAVKTLAGELRTSELTAIDARLLSEQEADMNHFDTVVVRSDYNSKALEYNNMLKGFPGRLLAALGIARPLELFGA